MTAQPIELLRIFYFLFVCILVSLAAQSFGFLIGAIMNIQVQVIKLSHKLQLKKTYF